MKAVVKGFKLDFFFGIMEIQLLIEFKNWADDVYMDYIDKCTEKQFTEKVPTLNKSIRQVLLHIYKSYWGDYHLISDRNWSNGPDFDELDKLEIITGIKNYNELMIDFISNQSVTEIIEYNEDGFDEPIKTTVENVLMNFVEHSSYHRGQLALLLRYHGINSLEMTNFHPYIWKYKQ